MYPPENEGFICKTKITTQCIQHSLQSSGFEAFKVNRKWSLINRVTRFQLVFYFYGRHLDIKKEYWNIIFVNLYTFVDLIVSILKAAIKATYLKQVNTFVY